MCYSNYKTESNLTFKSLESFLTESYFTFDIENLMMRKLMTIIIVCVMVASCNQNNSLLTFSKRKYMPRFNKGIELLDQSVKKIDNSNKSGIASIQATKKAKVYNSIMDEVLIVQNKINVAEDSGRIENGCDELIKMDGTIIQAKISEIGISEIKYKKCGNEEGPTYLVSKSDVFMVKFANGSTELIDSEKEKTENYDEEDYVNLERVDGNTALPEIEKTVEPMGLVAFVLSCVAFPAMILLGLGFVLAIPALILSILSLIKQNKDIRLFKQPGFARAAIIISSIILFIGLGIVFLIFI